MIETRPAVRPEIRVAVALITRDDRILVQQRAKGSHLEGAWEFPGGKLAADESWEEALTREVKEELGVRGVAAGIFDERTFDYPEKRVRLRFYWTVVEEEPAAPHRWVNARELLNLAPVPEANKELLPRIAQVLEGHPEPEPEGHQLGALAVWSAGFAPVAFVIAALAYLTLDNFAAVQHRNLGKLVESFAGVHALSGDRIVFITLFLVAEGGLVGWLYSRTVRRRPS